MNIQFYKKDLKKVKEILNGKEIVVLGGGNSSERKVSLISSKRVLQSLQSMALEARIIDPKLHRSDLFKCIGKPGLVFLGLHGGYGENGTIQGWLEFNQLKHTGSGVFQSSLGMNKIFSKKLLKQNYISTPDFLVLSDFSDKNGFIIKSRSKLGYPLVLKVANEGSGHGVFLIDTDSEFHKIVHSVLSSVDVQMIYSEKFIPGKEISACTLEIGGRVEALPILEAKFSEKFFSNSVRAKKDGYSNEVPANISQILTNKIKALAVKTHKVLGMSGFLRLDIRLEKGTNTPYVIELTTLPGLTDKSWFPAMAEKHGLDFNALVLKIILSALDNKNEPSYKS